MPDIVDVKNFVLSIRETGYRSFAHSLAELVDNSLQAHARNVSILISPELGGRIVVLDDGDGMTADALKTALQFGGSTRYGDRSGNGRFGMGLPTSAISLAKRIDVFSWSEGVTLRGHLDVDEIEASRRPRLPPPSVIPRPGFLPLSPTGTAVVLTKCDHAGPLDHLASLDQARFELRRIYRFAIQAGLKIDFEGIRLEPFDPLFLREQVAGTLAVQYGPTLEYPVPFNGTTSTVRVRFSELPVAKWRDMPNSNKRLLGISRGSGVSIVRHDREIAYGWYFLGTKKRENYDDWWRCEVSFEPELDELFGVNHTKQQITPCTELERLLTPDIENIGRILNSRVRREFVRTSRPKRSQTERDAAARDKFLPALLKRGNKVTIGVRYRVELDTSMVDNSFYRAELQDDEVVVYLNSHHPVASRFIAAKEMGGDDIALCECLLLAAARAELGAPSTKARWWFRNFRTGWSDTLAAFLGN